MDWKVSYTITGGRLSAERAAALEGRLGQIGDDPASGLGERAQGPAGAILGGSLVVASVADVRQVESLLELLNDLQGEFPEVEVLVDDSLELIWRSAPGGPFRIDLSDQLVTVSDSDLDGFALEEEDDDLDAILDQEREDAFGAAGDPTAADSYDGPEPELGPFDEPPWASWPLSTPEAVHVIADDVAAVTWEPQRLALTRRSDLQHRGEVFILDGDLKLIEPLLAHAVSADITLRGADGEVLWAAEKLIGHDVRQRLELHLEAALDADMAHQVDTVEVALDAYLRSELELARWTEGRPAMIIPARPVRARVAFREGLWPQPTLVACGEVFNTGDRLVTMVELVLDLLDAEGQAIDWALDGLAMLAPGDHRAFSIAAAAPAGGALNCRAATLRARIATRRREVVGRLCLTPP